MTRNKMLFTVNAMKLLSIKMLVLLAFLVGLSGTGTALGADDIDPETYDWSQTDDLWSFYVMDEYDNGQWVSMKYVEATENLIPSHCQTNADSNIPHYHFRYDFTTYQRDNADRYWDWYYDVSGTNASRISGTNATNVTDHFAYAMDGYAGSANYDYWIIPCEDSNKIFTDDCTKREGSGWSKDDRFAYEDYYGVYQHASIVKSIFKVRWKRDYSAIYEYTYRINPPDDCKATPGRSGLNQREGQPPLGVWEQDFWDGDDAHAYYKN